MKKLLKFSNTKKVLSGAMTLTLIASASMLLAPRAYAAGITAMSVTGTGITANSAAVNAAITPTVNFTTATALDTDGQTITITLNGMSVASGQTLAAADLTLSGCTSNTLEDAAGTADNGAHEVTITNGAAGNDNPVISIALDNTAGPTAPSCAAGAFTLAVAASNLVAHDTTASNYAISIITSKDSGLFFFYVGDENDVLVTATVDPSLSFVIRNSTDTADQANVNAATVGPNACNLGTLTTGAVGTCDYRLKVGTNASSYTVNIIADAALNYGANTINDIAEGSTVTAGTEGYGIALVGGSATGGTITESGDFNDDDTPIPTSSTPLYTSSGSNAPTSTDTTNTALVTHRAAIDASTVAGTYDQLVTYTVSATF